MSTSLKEASTEVLLLLLQVPSVYTALLLVIVFVIVSVHKRSRLDLDSMPSASLAELLQLLRNANRAQEWFRNCHEKYGPIFRFRLLHREVVMVADPLIAQQVLTTGPMYLPNKPSEYGAIDPAHGLHGQPGMLSHRDEKVWKHHRACLAPAYTLSALKPLQPAIMSAMVELVNRISTQAGNQATDFCLNHEVLMTTVQIELETFMQLPMSELGIDPHKVVCDMEFLTVVCGGFIHNPVRKAFYSSPTLAQLTHASRQFHETRVRFGSLTERIVKELEARGPYSDTECSLAACLMRIQDPYNPGQHASKGCIAAEVANSLLATETVPATVSWTMYLICSHPAIKARVVAELQAAGVPVGGSASEVAAALLKPETTKQLVYLQAVLSESLRLHPAGAPSSNRVVDRPLQLGPYRVPAGVLVWPCAYSIMTYSKNWDRPLEFDPERWLSSPGTGTHPESGATRFVPFSIGPKACIGQNFAMMEVRWAVALLLCCFNITVAPRMGTHQEVLDRTEMGFVYQPPGGIWFTAKHKTAA